MTSLHPYDRPHEYDGEPWFKDTGLGWRRVDYVGSYGVESVSFKTSFCQRN